VNNPNQLSALQASVKQITQTAHGFAVGDWLWFNGTAYALGQANNASSSVIIGMVSAVATVDVFVLTLEGYVDSSVGLTGLSPGVLYYLSNGTPGGMSPVSGTSVMPLFVADSPTSGYVKIGGGGGGGGGNPYQTPAFSGFSIESQSTSLEVGATSSANPVFAWSVTNLSNAVANTVAISDTTASVTLGTGLSLTSPFSATYAGVTKTSVSSENFRITGIDSESDTFSANFTISWYDRVYYGESSSSLLAASDITGLRVSGLQSAFPGIYDFIASPGEFKYLCFPVSMGTPIAFKDQSTNLNVPFSIPYIITVINSYGISINYNVFGTYYQIGGALNVVIS